MPTLLSQLKSQLAAVGTDINIAITQENDHVDIAISAASQSVIAPDTLQKVRAIAQSVINGRDDAKEHNRALTVRRVRDSHTSIAAQSTQLPPFVAVMSAKGGVGKSTVVVLLALALQQQGMRVGILDADLASPSIPTFFWPQDVPMETNAIKQQKVTPLLRHGCGIVSMASMMQQNQGLNWRGPMQAQTVRKLLGSVDWSGCDVVLVDTPPGIGDISFVLARARCLASALIVTTPQRVALCDVARGIDAALRLGIPAAGLVVNQYGLWLGADDHQQLWPDNDALLSSVSDRLPMGTVMQLPMVFPWTTLCDDGNAHCIPSYPATQPLWNTCLKPVAQAMKKHIQSAQAK